MAKPRAGTLLFAKRRQCSSLCRLHSTEHSSLASLRAALKLALLDPWCGCARAPPRACAAAASTENAERADAAGAAVAAGAWRGETHGETRLPSVSSFGNAAATGGVARLRACDMAVGDASCASASAPSSLSDGDGCSLAAAAGSRARAKTLPSSGAPCCVSVAACLIPLDSG